MKCLKCGYIHRNDQVTCPSCGFSLLRDGDMEKFRKEEIFANSEEANKTLIDLRKRLDAISEDIPVEEVSISSSKSPKKKSSSKRKKDDLESTEERAIIKEIESLTKDLELVDKKVEEESQIIEQLIDDKKVNLLKDEDSSLYEEVDDGDLFTDTKEFINLEKTIAISLNEDTKELEGLSLIDDINKQIDDVNEEAEVELSSKNKIEIIEEPEKTPVKKEGVLKKKVFLLTGVVIVAFMFTLLVFFWAVSRGSLGQESKVNYVDNMNVAMQTYYETEDIDDIIFILTEIKNDETKIKELQAKTRTICDSWILLYLNEELEDVEGFENATIKYKNLIERLYSDATVKSDDGIIRALTEKDRDDLIKQLDDIYSDSALFYDALELYNKKEYNDAYYYFNKIDKENSYYEKSVSYCNSIIDKIIEFINNDIEKLEEGIDTLDDDSKLRVYTSIEQIIIDYANVYFNIPLSDNTEYQELLGKYTSKVSDYSSVVNSQ